jgi:predicted KAP-like P-loop ATPase
MTCTPEGLFDQDYWTNVLYDGIDPLIQVPRDIVRIINTLSVTYPAVVGEVNPVDFIAIEALRVFLPSVYDVIRSNPDQFAGHKPDRQYGSRDNTTQEFHAAWQKNVPENLQASTKALIALPHRKR